MQGKEPNPDIAPTWALEALASARVGHLATSTEEGKPFAVPICFAFDGSRVYSSIDEKPKKARPLRLRRVSNIIKNPNVCLVVDEYTEDWHKLWYVLVIGKAAVTERGAQFPRALELLREKYGQYKEMNLEKLPLIMIKPLRIIAWKPQKTPATVKPKEYDRYKKSGSDALRVA